MRSARVLDFPPDALILTFFVESLQVIILSTNYWNSRCFATNPTITIIGDRQMKWLENTLNNEKESYYFWPYSCRVIVYTYVFLFHCLD